MQDTRNPQRLTADTRTPLRLSSAGPEWKDISTAQRTVLEPLHLQWPAMGALTKRRWLVLADRYPHMDDKEQAKLHERMLSWASLSAQQRNQARLNFSNVKRLTPEELLAKWQEYQALTAAEKERLKAEGIQAQKAQKAKNTRRKLTRKAALPEPSPVPSPVVPEPTAPAAPITTPVTHPQAAPARTLPPVIEAAPSPVQVPQEMYTMELEPLAPALPAAPSTPAAPTAPPAATDNAQPQHSAPSAAPEPPAPQP